MAAEILFIISIKIRHNAVLLSRGMVCLLLERVLWPKKLNLKRDLTVCQCQNIFSLISLGDLFTIANATLALFSQRFPNHTSAIELNRCE
jgi:hypothetical protein